MLPNEPVIYYLSSTEANEKEVFAITYDGKVLKIDKSIKLGSLGFRVIRNYKQKED